MNDLNVCEGEGGGVQADRQIQNKCVKSLNVFFLECFCINACK